MQCVVICEQQLLLHVAARALRMFPPGRLLPCCTCGAGAAAAMPAGTACWPNRVVDVPSKLPVWLYLVPCTCKKTAWHDGGSVSAELLLLSWPAAQPCNRFNRLLCHVL